MILSFRSQYLAELFELPSDIFHVNMPIEESLEVERLDEYISNITHDNGWMLHIGKENRGILYR
jgi:hypothetical protein